MEWKLRGTDLKDVLGWADANAADRTMPIWAVHRTSEEVGLIRLAGVDPATDPAIWPEWAASRRR